MKNLINKSYNQIGDFLKRRIVRMSLVGLFIVLLILYFLFSVTAPVRTYKKMHNTVFSDVEYTNSLHGIEGFDAADSLIKKKAFIQAQMKLAEADSIGIVINTREKVISLAINGVTIHTADIVNNSIDNILKQMELPVYYIYFSQPLIIETDISTIVREPIIVKNAPKDTVEAAQSVYLPDTLKKDPAFISFYTNSGIKIIFEQIERDSGRINRMRSGFFFKQKLWDFTSNVSHLLHMRLPEYSPTLRIQLAGDDIRTIYRALPLRARVVIAI